MFVNNDFSDLLNLFKTNNVKYMVIGGYAVVQYTEPRFTKDLDLWISTHPENADAVFNALKEFGAPLEGMSPKDFSEEGYFYQMGVPPVRVDILMGIPGVQFDEAWERRVEVQFDDVSVTIISREDLIRAKRAAGRPQDLLDADSLEKSSDQE
ncbi:nucleotidyltransferase [Candidatus Leptofilum sp.]|uniref:nucleotidyltransferase n=1 Tax=Candidatus Leptofilum sp. TaxID=3241576 RepID=UPI003B594017